MLQTDLIYGIQKKIKSGRNSESNEINVLEEATHSSKVEKSKEILLENYYTPGIISGISTQVKDSKKKTVSKKALIMEAFHLSKAQKKLSKDISYFNYLYESFVPEVFKEDYQMLLEGIFEDTIRLYQECDVTPRLISPALDTNELNENSIIDLYKNSLNHSIKENYTKPLLSGKISELYENEIRIITTKLLQENVNADVEQIRVYLPFEEALYQFNREVLIPTTAQSRIESFMEGTTAEYTDLLEESAEDILRAVEKKIKLLTSMVSPDMFDKAVDAEGVDAPKMAGISIAIDKNFDDEEHIPNDSLDDEDEAAEELADDEEAEALDVADSSSDIDDLEDGARNQTGLVTDVDELEGEAQEDKSELSPSEDSQDDDQPGAVEGNLAMVDSDQGDSGHADNKSDVGLSGEGNDNGVGDAANDATLPGSATKGNSNDVSDSKGELADTGAPEEVSDDGGSDSQTGATNDHDLTMSGSVGAGIGSDDVGVSDTGTDSSSDKSLSTSSNSLPADVADLPGKADASTGNSSDVSNSKGTAKPTRVTSSEVGEDGDNYNAGGGSMVDSEDEEVNTETPSESQMDEVEKEKDEVNGATTPRL